MTSASCDTTASSSAFKGQFGDLEALTVSLAMLTFANDAFSCRSCCRLDVQEGSDIPEGSASETLMSEAHKSFDLCPVL